MVRRERRDTPLCAHLATAVSIAVATAITTTIATAIASCAAGAACTDAAGGLVLALAAERLSLRRGYAMRHQRQQQPAATQRGMDSRHMGRGTRV